MTSKINYFLTSINSVAMLILLLFSVQIYAQENGNFNYFPPGITYDPDFQLLNRSWVTMWESGM